MAKPTAVPGLTHSTSATLAARRLLRARALDVDRQVDRLPQGMLPGEEPVHDLRVALRRLRAAVRLFKLGDPALAAGLRALQQAAGEVRDLQLQELWLQSPEGDPASALLRSVRPRLRRRERHFAGALVAYRAEHRPRLLAALEELRVPGRLDGDWVRGRLARRLERALERLPPARRLQPVPAHALRIAVKKVRYEAELLAPALPDLLAPLLEELQPLQEALGDLHDADVRVAALWEAGLRGTARASQRDRAALARRLKDELPSWTARFAARREALLGLLGPPPTARAPQTPRGARSPPLPASPGPSPRSRSRA
jgi:CHAD domain-containing protein